MIVEYNKVKSPKRGRAICSLQTQILKVEAMKKQAQGFDTLEITFVTCKIQLSNFSSMAEACDLF